MPSFSSMNSKLATKAYNKKAQQDDSVPGYHQKAQVYIKSAKKLGMQVKAEGDELIAYPPKKAQSGLLMKKEMKTSTSKMSQNMQALKGRPNIKISK